MLTRSADAGVDSFVKQRQSLFVFFQGHPEYDAITLLLEYRRDIGRFLRCERDTYPGMPHGYFDEETVHLLTNLRARALSDRREELLAEFPVETAAGKVTNTWRSTAESLYNWFAVHLRAEAAQAMRGMRVSTLLVLGLLMACSRPGASSAAAAPGANPPARAASSWSPKAAAAYLDRRADWWMGWQGAARDHGTFCVSCHTALPYALSRPALRERLADEAPSDEERRLLDNVTKRVRLRKEAGPYYGDGDSDKAIESRGTEAVLNALILAGHDAQSGRLNEDTQAALDNMWALQQARGDQAGAWPWLQFDLSPWEARDSPYYGAALAALAVGTAPGNYRSSAAIQKGLERLRAIWTANTRSSPCQSGGPAVGFTKLPGPRPST